MIVDVLGDLGAKVTAAPMQLDQQPGACQIAPTPALAKTPANTASASDWQRQPLALLCSGGLDSAILLAELARTAPLVQPIYIRFGLFWETAELAGLHHYVTALASPKVAPIVVLEQPVRTLYGDHWSVTGNGAPGFDDPDETVFLPGRNLLLLTQGGLWCHLHGIDTLALGPLAGNPFPDATPHFFNIASQALNESVLGKIRVVTPYLQLTKKEVLRRGAGLPLEATFSCLRPVAELHCGACNKCAERQLVFTALNITDQTQYANLPAPRPINQSNQPVTQAQEVSYV